MDIVLAIVFGAAVGLIAHFALPHRATRGAAIAPILGAVVSAAAWMGMTWAGAVTSDPWIWFAAILVPAIVTFPVVAIMARVRRVRDAHARDRLGIS
ncbi:hypothetical protein ABCS02_19710 [Microbacterium sp. X-17]|uniref:hypothetical protein n=1 Tax=Microbacterium sp. X-17 TaxID=3144404 RepID=UPI0031F4CE15